jgi:hypothetical protein
MNEWLQLLQVLQETNNKMGTAQKIDALSQIVQAQDQQIREIIQQHNSLVQTAATDQLLSLGFLALVLLLLGLLVWYVWRLEKQVKTLSANCERLTAEWNGDQRVLAVTVDGGQKIMSVTLDQLRNLAKYMGKPCAVDFMESPARHREAHVEVRT